MEEKDYKGFTLGLALVDAIPVLVFGASFILLGIAYGNVLFLIGASLCFIGGLLKVLWKVILAIKKRDVVWMNKQFRFTMIGGFVLIIVSVIIGFNTINWPQVGAAILSLPSLVFFIFGLLGMVTMGVLGAKLDPSKAKNNWIEQSVNSVAQICIFLGILFAII